MATNNSVNATNTQYQIVVGTGTGYSSISQGVTQQVLASNGASANPSMQDVAKVAAPYTFLLMGA
jgi:hypothetical protein